MAVSLNNQLLVDLIFTKVIVKHVWTQDWTVKCRLPMPYKQSQKRISLTIEEPDITVEYLVYYFATLIFAGFIPLLFIGWTQNDIENSAEINHGACSLYFLFGWITPKIHFLNSACVREPGNHDEDSLYTPFLSFLFMCLLKRGLVRGKGRVTFIIISARTR